MDSYMDIMKTVCAPEELKARLRLTAETAEAALTERPYLPESPSEPPKRRSYRAAVILTAAAACVAIVTVVFLLPLFGQSPPPFIIPTPSGSASSPASDPTAPPSATSEVSSHNTPPESADSTTDTSEVENSTTTARSIDPDRITSITIHKTVPPTGSAIIRERTAIERLVQYWEQAQSVRTIIDEPLPPGSTSYSISCEYMSFGIGNDAVYASVPDKTRDGYVTYKLPDGLREYVEKLYQEHHDKTGSTNISDTDAAAFSITSSLSPGPPVKKFIRDAALAARLTQYWQQAQSSRRVSDQPPAPGSTVFSVSCGEFTFGLANGILYHQIPGQPSVAMCYFYDQPDGLYEFIETTYTNSGEPEVPYGTVSKLHIAYNGQRTVTDILKIVSIMQVLEDCKYNGVYIEQAASNTAADVIAVIRNDDEKDASGSPVCAVLRSDCTLELYESFRYKISRNQYDALLGLLS